MLIGWWANLIAWILIGCNNLISKKEISKLSYGLAWGMTILFIIGRIIEYYVK